MIPDYKKEQVRDAVDIVQVIEAAIPLKKEGLEFVACCPFHKEKSPSFKVNGAKQIATCFGGCAKSWDVFAFVMEFEGVDFPEALKRLAKRANIVLEDPLARGPMPLARRGGEDAAEAVHCRQDAGSTGVMERRLYQERPRGAEKKLPGIDKSKYRKLVEGGKVWNYLVNQRKLDPEVLELYRIGETVDGEAIAFSYNEVTGVTATAPDGAGVKKIVQRTVFLKVLKVDREQTADGKWKKIEWRDPAGAPSILFGKQAIPPGMTRITITEGEIDAMSMMQFGFPAVSVPNGAGSMKWIDEEWDWLQQFERINLVFDSDRAGQAKLEEVVRRLGIERCVMVDLPLKDGEQQSREDAKGEEVFS
jgi:hypothetical protein